MFEYLLPLQRVITDYNSVLYTIKRQQFLEALSWQGGGQISPLLPWKPNGSTNTENCLDVESIVTLLKSLESISPSKKEFNSLCLLLTLEKISDDAEYTNWTVAYGRLECFRKLRNILYTITPGNNTLEPVLKSKHNNNNCGLLSMIAASLEYFKRENDSAYNVTSNNLLQGIWDNENSIIKPVNSYSDYQSSIPNITLAPEIVRNYCYNNSNDMGQVNITKVSAANLPSTRSSREREIISKTEDKISREELMPESNINSVSNNPPIPPPLSPTRSIKATDETDDNQYNQHQPISMKPRAPVVWTVDAPRSKDKDILDISEPIDNTKVGLSRFAPPLRRGNNQDKKEMELKKREIPLLPSEKVIEQGAKKISGGTTSTFLTERNSPPRAGTGNTKSKRQDAQDNITVVTNTSNFSADTFGTKAVPSKIPISIPAATKVVSPPRSGNNEALHNTDNKSKSGRSFASVYNVINDVKANLNENVAISAGTVTNTRHDEVWDNFNDKKLDIVPITLFEGSHPLRCVKVIQSSPLTDVSNGYVTLAIGSNNKTIHTVTYGSDSIRESTKFADIHKGSVYSIDVYRYLIASGSNDKTIRICNTLQGTVSEPGKAHTGTVRIVKFHPSGRLLGSAGAGDFVPRVWDVSTNNCISSNNFAAHKDCIHGFIWYDSNVFVTGCDQGQLIAHDIRTSQAIWSINKVTDIHNDKIGICCLEYYNNENESQNRIYEDMVLVGCTGGIISNLSFRERKIMYSERIHGDDIRGINILPNRHIKGSKSLPLDNLHTSIYYAASSFDGTSSIWRKDFSATNNRYYHSMYKLSGHTDKVLGITHVPISNDIITSGADGKVLLWRK